MAAPKYTTARARIHLEVYGSGVLEDAFNIEAASADWKDNTIEKQSTNEVVGVIARKIISTDGTLSITLGSADLDTLIRVTRSRESAQAAVTDGTFTFPAIEAGQSFKLPHGKITAITVPDKVLNVDYVIYKSSGIVKALVDFVAPVTGGTYAAGAARIAGFAAGDPVVYTVHITDEADGRYTQWFRWQPDLPSDMSFVSIDAWKQQAVTGPIFVDESRPADGPLGALGFILE